MIANKGGRSGAKSIYVTESFQILTFLERYDGLGLMKVWPNQAQKIIDAGLVKESQVQHSGEYIKGAVMFVSKSGEIRVKKSWEIMNCLGWNKNKSSKD